MDVLISATLLGALLSRKKLRKIWKKFWLTVDVYDFFEKRFQYLIVRFEISQKNARTLRKCLWSRLKGDAPLLDWVEPEIRVESFFVNVERDMKQLFSKYGAEGEALVKYMRMIGDSSGHAEPAVLGERTLKELFEFKLEMFLRRIKFDRSISQLDLTALLWRKFSKEVIFFDMCISY